MAATMDTAAITGTITMDTATATAHTIMLPGTSRGS
jgi:hypothetical protein